MAFDTNITTAMERVATEFNNLRNGLTGDTTGALTALVTADKTSLLAAINEVKNLADAAANSGGQTAAQVQTTVDAAIAALTDSAPGTLDTLNELATALGDDPDFAATITAGLAAKANIADVYTKTELGDPNANFVAAFEAALA